MDKDKSSVIIREPGLVSEILNTIDRLSSQGAAAPRPRGRCELARRVLGLVQLCGVCDTDLTSNATCCKIIISGITKPMRVALDNPSEDLVLCVTCLSNEGNHVIKLVACDNTEAATMLSRGDVLVVSTRLSVVLGGSRQPQGQAASYFITLYHQRGSTATATNIWLDYVQRP
ncbi:hypothetical pox protein [Squirrelpox virus]|uniref:Hypothetical pox protein n=1 Tax=Squirrelpox virus TaxID=240426 RepID=Q1HTU5_9POXV|nr:hypothetical pox protein [Squirrelpox virus]ABD51441.1 I5L [Squirrelpox virus]CCD83190.1 hypothetical pox protein [Squirrelpox virus]